MFSYTWLLWVYCRTRELSVVIHTRWMTVFKERFGWVYFIKLYFIAIFWAEKKATVIQWCEDNNGKLDSWTAMVINYGAVHIFLKEWEEAHHIFWFPVLFPLERKGLLPGFVMFYDYCWHRYSSGWRLMLSLYFVFMLFKESVPACTTVLTFNLRLEMFWIFWICQTKKSICFWFMF